MPSIDFEVWCSCGVGLCTETKVVVTGRGVSLEIQPCEKCMEAARSEGYDDGFDKGKEEAQEGDG